MCGIAGTIGFADQSLLDKMTAVITHRGPDDSGTKIFSTDNQQIGFGFRRLSIIDLSPLGHQPMSNHDETIWIVFNGEIYNYQDIRKELIAKGYQFKSGTDTEVIIYAYQEWGTSCVKKFNGMWGFAIYDQRKNSVFISRDRVGVKPIYYKVLSGNRLIFGSEVKSLLMCDEVERGMNPNGILSTLFFLWTPEPETAFKGISKIPAGYNLIIENGTTRLEKFWDIEFEGYGEDKGERYYADELESLLTDSVRLRMIADVEVGAFLSGGLDSSIITALMTKEQKRSIPTYTIAFTEEDKKFEAMPDDQKYAKIVAKHLGADYREIIIRPDIVSLLPKLIWHLDEPIADPASINTYLICKMAKESGTTVMLSGMGADEIFSGYRKHLSVKIASMYKMIPSFLRSGLVEPMVDALPVANEKGGFKLFRWAKRFMKSASLPDFESFIGNYSYYNESEMRNLLTPEFAETCFGEYQSSYPIKRHYDYRNEALAKKPNLDLITMMCFIDTKLFLASLNLTYSDKSSMAAGVEERVPFMDYRIVEFANRLPAKYKLNGLMGGFTQKYLLKKVSEKYIPRDVIYRPKAPFGAPLRSWVKKDLDGLISELLSPAQLKKRGIFNEKAITTMIARHKSGQEDSAHRIWALLTIELWMKQFVDIRVGQESISL